MQKLYGFDSLIEKFLSQEIPVKEFERVYLDVYLGDKIQISDEEFEILDELFFYVDSYTDLPIGLDEDPDDYLTEDQLRIRAGEALEKLRALDAEGQGGGGRN